MRTLGNLALIAIFAPCTLFIASIANAISEDCSDYDIAEETAASCEELVQRALIDPDVGIMREKVRISCDNVPGSPVGAPPMECCEEQQPLSGCSNKDTCAHYNPLRHKVCVCAKCGVSHCSDIKNAVLHEHLHGLQKCCRLDKVYCPWEPPSCEDIKVKLPDGGEMACPTA